MSTKSDSHYPSSLFWKSKGNDHDIPDKGNWWHKHYSHGTKNIEDSIGIGTSGIIRQVSVIQGDFAKHFPSRTVLRYLGLKASTPLHSLHDYYKAASLEEVFLASKLSPFHIPLQSWVNVCLQKFCGCGNANVVVDWLSLLSLLLLRFILCLLFQDSTVSQRRQ